MKNSRDYIITGAVVLVTLGLLELGLRVAGVKFEPSLYEPHPVLSFVLRPNAEGWTAKEGENYVRINSLGMRDRERRIEASPGTIRLAFLGDSFVAAEQVPLAETMSQLLEQRLSRVAGGTERRVEVLNFAAGGYALSQMLLSLDERVWAFSPDMVVVFVSELTVPNSYRKTKSLADLPFFTLDDGRLIPDPGNQPRAGTSAASLHRHQVLGDLHNRIRLLQLARTAQQAGLRDAFVWSKASASDTAALRRSEFMRVWPYSPPDDPDLATAWEISEAILARMVDATRERGAEFWLIQIGNAIEDDPRDAERERFLRINGLTDFRYASERYAAFAARHGVSYYYLAPAMREYSAKHGVPLRGFFNTRPYEGHWNAAGNAAAAEIIENEFRQRSRVFSMLNTDAKGD